MPTKVVESANFYLGQVELAVDFLRRTLIEQKGLINRKQKNCVAPGTYREFSYI
jgi:hypothetical protein